MNTQNQLIGEWESLASRAGLTQSDGLGRDLIQRYAEAQRSFHGPDHLYQVIQVLQRISKDDRLLFAAWFHDAIYQPGRSDNEQLSAELALASLIRCGYAEKSALFVADAVLATTGHRAMNTGVAPLLDADLSVLGASAEAYEKYRLGVRYEYSSLKPEVFNSGRMAFINGMLKRSAIYQTTYGRDQFEAAARRNLRAELVALESEISGR